MCISREIKGFTRILVRSGDAIGLFEKLKKKRLFSLEDSDKTRRRAAGEPFCTRQ